MQPKLIIRQLGVQDYAQTWQAMHAFTDSRNEQTADEIWFVQHPAVFTQGTAGKAEHLLRSSNIPVVQSDRGGQITYHGLGQQVMYILIDLKRLKTQGNPISVRDLVTALEQTVVKTLAEYNIKAQPKPDAPGVYVEQKKICSLGLRIRKGCSFHGLALNIQMDLTPFDYINPCGYAGLEMCQLSDFIDTVEIHFPNICTQLTQHFTDILGYNMQQIIYK